MSTSDQSAEAGGSRAGYLIDVEGQEREKKVVRLFCAMPFIFDELLYALGVPGEFHWVLLEVPHGRLIEDRFGDVDLIAGPLAWKDSDEIGPLINKNREAHPDAPGHLHAYCAAVELAGQGGLLWPPPMDHLIAIEAKCAYFHGGRKQVMSQKASRSNTRIVRMQIEDLLEAIPFNRVALLDFIVNPPATGIDGQAWLNAASVAVRSLDEMRTTLEGRLLSDSPSGHFVMSWGAIEGGTEASRGTGGPIQFRPAVENPRLGETAVQERRKQMEKGLVRLLEEYPRPLSFPVNLHAGMQVEAVHKEENQNVD